jgi:predicted methyltransferase
MARRPIVKNGFDIRVIQRTVAFLSVATLVPVGPVSAQPMPANVSLSAIRSDEQERDKREKLPDIIQSLQLVPGSIVADLGTGYGYYASRFSPIVGPTGRVFAEEISTPPAREGWPANAG